MSDTATSAAETPLFNRDDVLRCPNDMIYSKVAELAVQFAILGYSDTASNLIGKINKHDWYNARDVRLRPLQLLWDLTVQWPEGELERVRQEIQDARQRAAERKIKDDDGKETGKKVKLEVDESPITREDVKKHIDEMYHNAAKCWWYPERPPHWTYPGVKSPPGPHDPELDLSGEDIKKRINGLLDAIEKGNKTPGRLPPSAKTVVMPSDALVSALDLRLRLQEMGIHEDAEVPSSEDILRTISKDLREWSTINELVQSKRAWPLLKDGLLVKFLNINKLKLDLFASQFEDTVTERLERGMQHPPTPPMRELLDIINHNTLTNPESIKQYEGMAPVPTTILRSPASDAQIAETERRLGTALPEDYKAYLRVTNGNDRAFSGIIHTHELFKSEDIRWVADKESYFSDLTVHIPADMMSIMGALGESPIDWPTLGKALLIGEYDCFHLFLMRPDDVNKVKVKVRGILDDEGVGEDVKASVRNVVQGFAGSMEQFEEIDWCVVDWDTAPAQRAWRSFGAYLGHVAEEGKAAEKDCWNKRYDEFFGYLLVDGSQEE